MAVMSCCLTGRDAQWCSNSNEFINKTSVDGLQRKYPDVTIQSSSKQLGSTLVTSRHFAMTTGHFLLSENGQCYKYVTYVLKDVEEYKCNIIEYIEI